MYHGDIALEGTIDIKFTTRRFSTGAPFTLAGTPVISAYVGNSVTQITAGITLSVDFDGVTGLNNVRVVAAAADGYAAGTNVALVITTGTVDSVSVVGEVIGSFSIAHRPAQGIASVARDAIADSVLLRNVSNVEATAGEHTLCTVILGTLEWSISGATWTIKRTNGSTTHATKTLTSDAAAENIIAVT